MSLVASVEEVGEVGEGAALARHAAPPDGVSVAEGVEVSPRIARFFAEHRPPTPCLVLDLAVVAQRYREMRHALPFATPYYAVKACPEPDVIRTLVELGACFDVASPAEIDLCLEQGAEPGSLSYGNTVKKVSDIAYAHARGAAVRVRQPPRGREAGRRGSGRLGVLPPPRRQHRRPLAPVRQVRLLRRVRGRPAPDRRPPRPPAPRAVVPRRLPADRPSRWEASIASAATVFTALAEVGIDLEMLDIGGATRPVTSTTSAP